jgi:PAS domain S-box-containing protein
MKGGKKEPALVPKNAIAKPKNRRDDCAGTDARGAVAHEAPKTQQRIMNKPRESVVKPATPAAATKLVRVSHMEENRRQDIVGGKRTEARLKANQEQPDEFPHALDLVPAMVRKLSGEILLWGRGIQAVYGWPVEEAVGRISHELLATEFPVSLHEIEAELLAIGVWQGELVRPPCDGHRMVVASRWALNRRDGGDAASVLEFDSDVTETKRAQSMLKEREARLRSILETAPDAIITIDERGVIQSFSSAAEKLFGYAAGEVIGRNVKILMPAPHRENHDAYLTRYVKTGEKHIIGIGRQVEAQRRTVLSSQWNSRSAR